MHLLREYMHFLVIFLGWVMLPHLQATSTDHGGPQTPDVSIERLRPNHFITVDFHLQLLRRFRRHELRDRNQRVCFWSLRERRVQ